MNDNITGELILSAYNEFSKIVEFCESMGDQAKNDYLNIVCEAMDEEMSNIVMGWKPSDNKMYILKKCDIKNKNFAFKLTTDKITIKDYIYMCQPLLIDMYTPDTFELLTGMVFIPNMNEEISLTASSVIYRTLVGSLLLEALLRIYYVTGWLSGDNLTENRLSDAVLVNSWWNGIVNKYPLSMKSIINDKVVEQSLYLKPTIILHPNRSISLFNIHLVEYSNNK